MRDGSHHDGSRGWQHVLYFVQSSVTRDALGVKTSRPRFARRRIKACRNCHLLGECHRRHPNTINAIHTTISHTGKMRLLTGPQISTILRNLTQQDARTLLEALSTALATYTAQKAGSTTAQTLHQPMRTVIQTSQGHTTLFMPISDEQTTAVKVATVPKSGDIQGAITLYSDVGELLGVLNAAEITAFRTALATMTVLTRWVEGSEEVRDRHLVVFGAGKQAEWHVRLVLLLVPNVTKVVVINRSKGRLDRFKESVLDEIGATYGDVQFETLCAESSESYTEDVRKRLYEASIICCCTPSKEPLFPATNLSDSNSPVKKRFLSLIGSYKPEMQEIDTETVQQASQIIVDSKEACLEEAGELIRAKKTKEDLVEAGELFDSKGRSTINSDNALTIFKCVGFALMDLTLAQALLNMAEEKGEGSVFESF